MNQKKKLLFLILGFDTGGTEKATFDVITHINPEKYDITLMSIYGGGYFWDQLPAYVHKKYFFPRFMRYVIRYVYYAPARLVYRTFVHEKYDVEIACGDNSPSRIINHSPNKKSKKIAWIHMDVIARGFNGLGTWTERGRKTFFKNFDKIVNVSKNCEKQFNRKFNYHLPTAAIPNLVDAAEIRKKADEHLETNLSSDAFNIVCMGRLMGEKGFDRLVDAYNQIKDKIRRNVKITIIGEGVLQDEIQQQIDNCGLSDTIVLAGYHNNPYPILKQADLFVLSSYDESFALVVAEAMVLGIPVMSTRCTGPVELLKDGEAGLLVENSTEGIRDGLLKVLTDDEFYAQMKQTAAQNKDNFDVQKTVAEIEELFDEEK